MSQPTIVLMTDFGTRDIYVGVLKGVIRGICPQAHILDLTHDIPAQSVSTGAWALKNAYRFFPPASHFLAVVDPDVGSDRFPLAVRAGGYVFVAPDNGLLTHIVRAHPPQQAVALQNRAYALEHISDTFHGRDIFAPAIAHLANGVALDALGPAISGMVELEVAPAQRAHRLVTGSVIHIDHFGNLITNIETLRWEAERVLRLEDVSFPALTAAITILDATIRGVQRAYYEVRNGDLLAQVDSSGALEIAVYRGSAAAYLGASVGDVVTLKW